MIVAKFDKPGIDGQTFKIKLCKDWFYKSSDLIYKVVGKKAVPKMINNVNRHMSRQFYKVGPLLRKHKRTATHYRTVEPWELKDANHSKFR